MTDESRWIERGRDIFLSEGHSYGCAETVFMVLKEAYGLPEASDSSPAMALNGGIAYSGGTCGALTGAALAMGMLAERRIRDHKAAKLAARRIIAAAMDRFQAEFGAINCRELTGYTLRDEEQHRKFTESYPWRERCMRQVELVLEGLLPLGDLDAWNQALARE